MEKIDILIADDHRQISDSIRLALRSNERINNVDTFVDGNEVFAALQEKQYGLYILDLLLPGKTGLELVKIIEKRQPDAKIIINTMREEIWTVKQLVRLGVMGIVMKSSSLEHITRAVEAVMAGEQYYCPHFGTLIAKYRDIEVPVLTKRELDVLRLIMQGLTTVNIGDRLFISENTVEAFRKSLMQKLRARNMSHLVNIIHSLGIEY